MHHILRFSTLPVLFLALSVSCPVVAEAGNEALDLDAVRAPVPSPDGRFLLIRAERDESGLVEVHILDRQTLTAVALAPYSRHATALWSPDGYHLAFNEYAGSDTTDCHVYELSVDQGKLTAQRKDVGGAFIRLEEASPLARMSHRYIVAREWLSPDTLLLGIRGHAPVDGVRPAAVSWKYRYRLDGTFTKVGTPKSQLPPAPQRRRHGHTKDERRETEQCV